MRHVLEVYQDEADTTVPTGFNGAMIGSGKYIPSSELQRSTLNALNHKVISEDAYNILKDFDGIAKKVRIVGKVLLVAGVALEALELYQTVEADLHDADRKIGKKTYSSIASIVGSWGLSAILAETRRILTKLEKPALAELIPEFDSDYFECEYFAYQEALSGKDILRQKDDLRKSDFVLKVSRHQSHNYLLIETAEDPMICIGYIQALCVQEGRKLIFR